MSTMSLSPRHVARSCVPSVMSSTFLASFPSTSSTSTSRPLDAPPPYRSAEKGEGARRKEGAEGATDEEEKEDEGKETGGAEGATDEEEEEKREG